MRRRRELSTRLACCCAKGRSAPGGFFVGMRISTSGSVKPRKPRSCNNRLPAGRGYGVASASRLSWRRPPTVSLRKRMRSRALTSRMFFIAVDTVFDVKPEKRLLDLGEDAGVLTSVKDNRDRG